MTAAQDQQVLITREFDAPRERVWDAWTDPDRVARWFGPEGFETGEVEIDLRVGGRYALVMARGEARHPVVYEIVELEAPRLLVLRSEPMPEVGIHEPTLTRVELHDDGDRTRMTLSDGPYVEASHAERGWHAAFAKMASLLA
jgi:uncharacterized protein YndB with AHSA1/START domain